jgi:hypothetical protein
MGLAFGFVRRFSTLVAVTACVALVACSPESPSPNVSGRPGPSPVVERTDKIATSNWTLRFPTDWQVQRLINACHDVLRGVVVTSASFVFTPRFDHPCSWRRYGRWEMAGFPDDGVAVVGRASILVSVGRS